MTSDSRNPKQMGSSLYWTSQWLLSASLLHRSVPTLLEQWQTPAPGDHYALCTSGGCGFCSVRVLRLCRDTPHPAEAGNMLRASSHDVQILTCPDHGLLFPSLWAWFTVALTGEAWLPVPRMPIKETSNGGKWRRLIQCGRSPKRHK